MSVTAHQPQHTMHGSERPWHRWEDWVSLVLGVWLFIAPWIWGNSAHPAATEMTSAWNAWIVGGIFIVMSLISLASPVQLWTEGVNIIASIWLFIAPWALGFAAAGHSAAWNQWVVAIIVFVVGICAYNDGKRDLTGVGGTTPRV